MNTYKEIKEIAKLRAKTKRLINTTALDMAIKSLEKQISKTAIYGDDEQDFIRCPNCNYELAYVDDYYYEKYNYCPNCGQKIKWE